MVTARHADSAEQAHKILRAIDNEPRGGAAVRTSPVRPLATSPFPRSRRAVPFWTRNSKDGRWLPEGVIAYFQGIMESVRAVDLSAPPGAGQVGALSRIARAVEAVARQNSSAWSAVSESVGRLADALAPAVSDIVDSRHIAGVTPMPRKPKQAKHIITVIVNGTPVAVVLHPPSGERSFWYAYWNRAVASRSTGQRTLKDAIIAAKNMVRNGRYPQKVWK